MLDYTIISGNIFQDLGFPNAEEKLAQVKLASVIADILEQKQITSETAGKILSLESEQVENLTNGILKNFTIEQLLMLLVKLGQKIEILVMDGDRSELKSENSIKICHQKVA